MRITGGQAGGRKLISPKSGSKNYIRPTSDRVREALFSILGNNIAGAKVLDLFAGTGSFGLDALSRGAEFVVFADNEVYSLDMISRNLQNCFDQPQANLIKLDLQKKSSYSSLKKRFSDNVPFDLIFLDPPYGKKLAETSLTMIEKTGLVAAGGRVIAEERWNISLPENIGSLDLQFQRRYGETGIWIYELKTA